MRHKFKCPQCEIYEEDIDLNESGPIVTNCPKCGVIIELEDFEFVFETCVHCEKKKNSDSSEICEDCWWKMWEELQKSKSIKTGIEIHKKYHRRKEV